MVPGTYTVKPTMLYHTNGYSMVRFACEGERDGVLCFVPHYLLKRPVIMKPWTSDFNFKEEILSTIPLWIKLPNLHLNCWNVVALSKIGSSLGQPLYADKCTTQASRISYARILVEVDVTREFPTSIKVKDPKGNICKQQVQYDWKPTFLSKMLTSGICLQREICSPHLLRTKIHRVIRHLH